MEKTPVKIRAVLYILLAGVLLLTTSSGYLYRQNKTYRLENRRLLIENDSVLSENIELKSALKHQRASAFKDGHRLFKTTEDQ